MTARGVLGGPGRRSTVPSVLVLLVALTLGGCGGDSGDDADPQGGDTVSGAGPTGAGETDDTGDSGALDVCGLLGPADLEDAFGSPFDTGESVHQEQTGGDQCVWSNTDPPPVRSFSLTVLREGSLSEGFEDAGLTVESLFQDTKDLMPDVEEIDLGDDAYLSGTTLAVLDGDTSYSFTTVFGDSPEAIAGMRTLAAQVVG